MNTGTEDTMKHNSNGPTKASDYVLGILSPSERETFETRLAGNEALRADLAFWQDHFLALSETAPELELNPDGFATIEALLDGQTHKPKDYGDLIVVRQAEGEWRPLLPGVTKKTLFVNQPEATETFLLRLEPGASLPAHGHNSTEECLVLEGEITIGRARFGVGDYQVALADIQHLPVISDTGALLFIRGELHT